MDEEITCAICQKSLDNVNQKSLDNVNSAWEGKSLRELTEQAESAMTSYKLFQVRKYTKHAAASSKD